jgi:hypothetical protein
LLAGSVFFTACNKDKDAVQTTADSSIEFKITQTDFNFKSDVPSCSELSMDYVKFTINDVVYKSRIFYVNGEMLTEVVKLPVGNYEMTEFLVYNDNGTPNDDSDDVLVKASPAPGSQYYDLMTNKLNLDITVDPFYKKQISIDVLCFEDLFYESFGFTWFQFNDIKIERLCFFGDICTGKLDDFAGSLYESQPEGIQMDMPAIFQVKVFKGDNNVPFRTFGNEEWLGVGQCTEVYWPNNLNIDGEEFTFELWVLLPSGNTFAYNLINSWTFSDAEGVEAGEDGVVDFVMGSCQYEGADYQFPFWMNLPSTTFQMTVGNVSSPGANGSYFDITLSGIGEGYDIENTSYGVWCGDHDELIYLGSTHTVNALNSLSNVLPSDLTLTRDQINLINYFFNNLPNMIEDFDYNDYSSNWEDIQNTIWALAGDITPTGNALTYYNHVMTYGQNYQVPPGGWAAIIFFDSPYVQLVFTIVDP